MTERGDMPPNWVAAQRWLERLKAAGPDMSGPEHPLGFDEADYGVGRTYVRCARLGLTGVLMAWFPNEDLCVVSLDGSGKLTVPRNSLTVLTEATR